MEIKFEDVNDGDTIYVRIICSTNTIIYHRIYNIVKCDKIVMTCNDMFTNYNVNNANEHFAEITSHICSSIDKDDFEEYLKDIITKEEFEEGAKIVVNKVTYNLDNHEK